MSQRIVSMVKIIIIDTSGKASEAEYDPSSSLYKKCGFRKEDGFEERHTWSGITLPKNDTKYSIAVYSRNHGRAGSENKFEMPPPIDKDLYFGKIAVLGFSGKKQMDLSVSLWNKLWENLMGGFEDLNGPSESDETDELEDEDPENITSDGYLKDDFVVDDDEDEEYYDGDCGSELEEEEYDE